MPKIKSNSAWMREWINRVDGKRTYTTDGKIVYCQPCQQQVPSKKFSQLKQHNETAKHKSNVELFMRPSGSMQKQPFLADTSKNRDQFTMELCNALISANIPFYKMENKEFRGFLEKHCKRTFPNRMTLQNHLGMCYEQKMDELKKDFAGKQIWASVDETTDKKGRYVANLIVGIMDGKINKPELVAVKFLEKTNSETIARFVNDNLRPFISAENLLLLVTDGARYMIKAAKGLKVFYPNLIHLTCLCHGLNRVCEEIRGHFTDVDELIASTKKVFSKAPSRVAKFRELCNLPLPPRPIITRWGTWLNAALYYCEHFDQISAIVECFNQSDSDAIKKSQNSFKKLNLKADLAFIRANFDYLPDAIDKLQARNLSLVESLDILASVGNEMNLVPGNVGKLVQEKFSAVLRNNPGFDQMREIGMVLRGEHVQIHLPPDVIANYKHAPIQSCEVERSFSIYKNILADNRMSFTAENLEKFLICNCKNNR